MISVKEVLRGVLRRLNDLFMLDGDKAFYLVFYRYQSTISLHNYGDDVAPLRSIGITASV